MTSIIIQLKDNYIVGDNMEYLLDNNLNEKCIGKSYNERIELEQVYIRIMVDHKYKFIEATITKKEHVKRKNVDLSKIINYISDFIDSNNIFLCDYDEIIGQGFLERKYVHYLNIEDLKITNEDIKTIQAKFSELSGLFVNNCTYYSDCNFGILNISHLELSDSTIYSLDSLNGYKGKKLLLHNVYIKGQNKNTLHLNSVIIKFEETNIDYEHFILTTSAPKLKILFINNKRKIYRDKDLLFISGFYNLEYLEVNGIVHDWDQIKKLDKLGKVLKLYCDNPTELEKLKRLRAKKIEEYSKDPRFIERDYLLQQNGYMCNEYLKFYYELFVSKLERVKWLDKISTKSLENIKKELIYIFNLTPEEKFNISREEKEYLTMDEEVFGLSPRGDRPDDDQYELVSSSMPFDEDQGIEYWEKNKRIKIL